MIQRPLSSLQIVVLAAGFSSRLGRSKALARIHGVSLIARTIAVLAHLTRQPIVVVTAQRATRVHLELRGRRIAFLANPDRAAGLSTSVVRGLRKARYSSATLLLPADLPDLAPRDIARLISRWRGARRRIVACEMAGRAAAPLILPKFLYGQAQRLCGDVGLRSLVAEIGKEQWILVALPSAGRDIDTPQDLADARRRAPRSIKSKRNDVIRSGRKSRTEDL
jgi:molybdenum cofactor cytidylyltransferase